MEYGPGSMDFSTVSVCMHSCTNGCIRVSMVAFVCQWLHMCLISLHSCQHCLFGCNRTRLWVFPTSWFCPYIPINPPLPSLDYWSNYPQIGVTFSLISHFDFEVGWQKMVPITCSLIHTSRARSANNSPRLWEPDQPSTWWAMTYSILNAWT
jgi:hypothetical protein